MKQITLGRTGITVPQNAFGALPIQRISREEAVRLLRRICAEGESPEQIAADCGFRDIGNPWEEEPEETVTVVIPTVYESITTQEEADEIRKKNGYESATLEEDGSLTIIMSRSRHDEMIRQFRDSVDRGISEILAADTGSEIEKIEYNDDYSVFTVTVEGDEIGIVERQTADELVMYGVLYHIYTGNDVDHIQVDYVNRQSGEVIESADSGSLTGAY